MQRRRKRNPFLVAGYVALGIAFLLVVFQSGSLRNFLGLVLGVTVPLSMSTKIPTSKGEIPTWYLTAPVGVLLLFYWWNT
jgi:hypothetical protein